MMGSKNEQKLKNAHNQSITFQISMPQMVDRILALRSSKVFSP